MKKLVKSLKVNNSILFHEPWSSMVKKNHRSIKSLVIKCVKSETHIPCILDATNYFHGIKTAECSANLIQAQRDYFGAHTYQKKGNISGMNYHTDWSI